MLPIGLFLDFKISTMAPGGAPRDLDNLCEPVFSVLVNGLGWFGGVRTNILWWAASTEVSEAAGVQIRLSDAASFPSRDDMPAFMLTYPGPLPKSGRDATMANAVQTDRSTPLSPEGLEVHLRFGPKGLNIGDISTGRGKNVIDCLYPVLGGRAGRPDDHRIKRLHVAKGCSDAPSEGVIVTIWRA